MSTTRHFLLGCLFLPLALNAQRSAEEHLASARTAYAIDSLDQALQHADSAIQRDATVSGGYKLRGDIKQRMRNSHGALLDYTRAEKQDPDDARLYVSRSAIHITEGHLKEAVKDCDRAIDLDPNDADAWYNRACADYMGRNNEGALRSLERAIKLKPTLADGLFLRGVVRGEQYKEAAGIQDIQAALALNPDIPGAWMSLGVLQFENQDYPGAIASFTRAIAIGGAELKVAYYYRGDCHYHMEDKDKACPDWRKSAELGDKDAQFIMRYYCNTDADKIPKKPSKRRNTVIEF
ncbi:MAG: tetratricopeptide repeat protein [Flavobacteriales bacterium]|nr:tetratricopeptide repeat protein [Flavobacteriales bacterium]